MKEHEGDYDVYYECYECGEETDVEDTMIDEDNNVLCIWCFDERTEGYE